MAQDPRLSVVQALAELHRRRSYSNIVLDQLLRTAELSTADRSLASRLFYGVIERRLTLDHVLSRASSVPLRKLHPLVHETLRVALYQILYMDKVPDSAAVNEAVSGVRRLKQGQASGFVNGVLRGILRRRDVLFDDLPTGDEGLSIQHSCPVELISFWRRTYGDAMAERLVAAVNETPESFLRVNTLRITDEKFSEILKKLGANHQICEDLPHCFRLNCGYLLNNLASDEKNCYYYQDKASQWACLAFGARPGEAVADVCAAPGGKSFTVAQMMNNTGRLLACDLYPAKCETIDRRAEELGITILCTAARDASAPCPEQLRGSFDRVLCDVPCSGLGVIRRKPEIRYKDLREFDELPALQYRILERGAEMVKHGGVLQYSTCTLNPAENEEVVARFLREHPEFSPRILPLDSCFAAAGLEPSHTITLFPPVHGTDGFFIAGFCKK
ncbi:MAG: 16S rRNA (cytosine(967)-C(5))-methyltransferase RsmB [Clostridia bacterium]|nr:16S rRNA (cytosine(967)-C(5))-methyltransferase RsmB [Clostridia bacterium]